jgi:hypothetical protein
MRRRLLLASFIGSLASASIAACGGSDSSPPVDQDAGPTGTATADARTDFDVTTTSDGGTQDATTQDVSSGDDASASDGSDASASDVADAITNDADGATTDGSEVDATDAADAAVACTGNNTACTRGDNTAGLCQGGVCTTCNDPGDDATCTTAYATDGGPSSYVCVQGACVPGDCHTSTTCAGKVCTNNSCASCANDTACTSDSTYGANTICSESSGTCVSNTCSTANAACATSASHFCCSVSLPLGDGGTTPGNVCLSGNCCDNSQCGGATPACIVNTCTACDAHSGTLWVVDPISGSDLTTGSGTAGGTSSGACAFKTITKAIAALSAAAQADAGSGTPPVGTKILVRGPSVALAGETFPIDLPANVTLEGQNGVRIGRGGSTLLSTSATGTKLVNLEFDGESLATFCVDANTTAALTLEGVDIHDCGIGVRARQSAFLTVGPGSHLHANSTGLRVQNTAKAQIASNGAQILIDSNTSTGVFVADTAALNVTGDSSTNSVMLRQNNVGLWFQQTPGSGDLPTSLIDGLVAKANTSAGIEINGGSSMTLRRSASVGNLYGVLVMSGVVAGSENDTSKIDLGTDASADAGVNFGANILQTKSAAAGGVPNTGAGICLLIQPNKSQTLKARGNAFASLDHTTEVNCATTAATLDSSPNCTGAADVAGQGLNGNNVVVESCTF